MVGNCQHPKLLSTCISGRWYSWHIAISYSEPSNFLLRMLDENEGLWKGPILRQSWLVLWNVIQYNKSAICELLEPVLSRAIRFRRACAVRSQKALGTRLGTLYTPQNCLLCPIQSKSYLYPHPPHGWVKLIYFLVILWGCKTGLRTVVMYSENRK